jgi:hypothetical protein
MRSAANDPVALFLRSILALDRRALLDDIAARRAWLEMAISAALIPAEREVILAASALMLRLATYPPAKG